MILTGKDKVRDYRKNFHYLFLLEKFQREDKMFRLVDIYSKNYVIWRSQ